MRRVIKNKNHFKTLFCAKARHLKQSEGSIFIRQSRFFTSLGGCFLGFKTASRVGLWCFLLFLVQCGAVGTRAVDSSKPPTVEVTFRNQSQFTIEALYIHAAVDNYHDQTNRLETPMTPDTLLEFEIPRLTWFVTVYRKPSQDAAVLAYTTAKAWDPDKYPVLTYSDRQYRASASVNGM